MRRAAEGFIPYLAWNTRVKWAWPLKHQRAAIPAMLRWASSGSDRSRMADSRRPLAVAATLRVAGAAAAGLDDKAAWLLSDEALAALFDTDDAAEGQLAFTQKRRPTWTGR